MLPNLTAREQQILDLIAEGNTNRQISHDLSISESTVENHIHHIYGKLGISNRAQAVAHVFKSRVFQKNRGNPSWQNTN
jgi:ATP/maltotriose-dependent transcriptional regulator MalT